MQEAGFITADSVEVLFKPSQRQPRLLGDGGRVAAGSRHGIDNPVMVHGGRTALGGTGYAVDGH